MTNLRFYFDESVDLAVSEQLALVGLDVVSAHSLGVLGDQDRHHLQRATQMERVLCTCDSDFIELAQENTEHSGIVFGAMQAFSIGDWVRYIRRLHAQKTADQVNGLVFYVERK